MIDISGHPTAERGINNALIVQAEHVNAAVLILIALFPDVGQVGPDELPDVLDDHLALLEVARGVQSQPLDLGAREDNVLPPFLLHFTVLRTFGGDKILAVGSHGLQPDQKVAKVLGNPSVDLLARATLEIVYALNMRSQLRFRPGAARRVNRQREFKHRVAPILEGVVRQRLYAGQALEDLDDVWLCEAEEIEAGEVLREQLRRVRGFSELFNVRDDCCAGIAAGFVLEDDVVVARLLDLDDELRLVVRLGHAAEVLAPLVHIPRME